jgi:hypothetical protein
MQGIYTYIPETTYVPREHHVAAILVLLFMELISLVPALLSSLWSLSSSSWCFVTHFRFYSSTICEKNNLFCKFFLIFPFP